MNTKALSEAIGQKAKTVEDNDASELLRVLARIVRGQNLQMAFGAPGDWGYGTPIGEALRSDRTEGVAENTLGVTGAQTVRRICTGCTRPFHTVDPSDSLCGLCVLGRRLDTCS